MDRQTVLNPQAYIQNMSGISYNYLVVSQTCSRQCAGCLAASPIAKPGFATVDAVRKASRFMRRMNRDQSMLKIDISGGDAMLNPNLYDFFPILREEHPAADIKVRCNGEGLSRMKDEHWAAFRQYDILLDVRSYTLPEMYNIKTICGPFVPRRPEHLKILRAFLKTPCLLSTTHKHCAQRFCQQLLNISCNNLPKTEDDILTVQEKQAIWNKGLTPPIIDALKEFVKLWDASLLGEWQTEARKHEVKCDAFEFGYETPILFNSIQYVEKPRVNGWQRYLWCSEPNRCVGIDCCLPRPRYFRCSLPMAWRHIEARWPETKADSQLVKDVDYFEIDDYLDTPINETLDKITRCYSLPACQHCCRGESPLRYSADTHSKKIKEEYVLVEDKSIVEGYPDFVYQSEKWREA